MPIRKTTQPDSDKMNRIIAEAQNNRKLREQGYRSQALKIFAWICARCGREFAQKNLHMLTVHHKDHNHESNPPDGSNWELLCIYCHDQEHMREVCEVGNIEDGAHEKQGPAVTFSPFANLNAMLQNKK